MAIPYFSKQDFLQAALNLMPTGRAWPKFPGTNLYKLTEALVGSFQRLAQRGGNLLTDSYPVTTNELLIEWEKSLGLPDPCMGIAPTFLARRNQVVARFRGLGGQSIPYLIQFASNLGFQITIDEFASFKMGENVMGDILNSEYADFTMLIHGPLLGLIEFRMGESVMGDFLEAAFPNLVLECEIHRVAPAHVITAFQYGAGQVHSYPPPIPIIAPPDDGRHNFEPIFVPEGSPAPFFPPVIGPGGTPPTPPVTPVGTAPGQVTITSASFDSSNVLTIGWSTTSGSDPITYTVYAAASTGGPFSIVAVSDTTFVSVSFSTTATRISTNTTSDPLMRLTRTKLPVNENPVTKPFFASNNS